MTQAQLGIEFELVQIIDTTGEESLSKKTQKVYRDSVNCHNNFRCTYSVEWCPYPCFGHYFAVVGGFQRNSVSIYKLTSLPGPGMAREEGVSLVQTYVDMAEEEEFYCCAWAMASDSSLMLFVAGYHGVIKGINVSTMELGTVLPGHLSEVNELTLIPNQPGLILSASKDESIRLWNFNTHVCVAVFAGKKGHRQHVLTIDTHPLGNCFASAGHDFSVKIWGLTDPALVETIELSHSYGRRGEPEDESTAFPTSSQMHPLFTTSNSDQGRLHGMHFIDCVRWYGDFLLSFCADKQVLLWTPDSSRYPGATHVLRDFNCPGDECWFTKFAVCHQLDLLAVGNHAGKVFIHRISDDVPGVPVDDFDIAPGTNAGAAAAVAAAVAAEEEEEEEAGSCAASPRPKYHDVGSLPAHRINKEPQVQPKCVLGHKECTSLVRHISFNAASTHLVSGCDDGSVWVWRLACSSLRVTQSGSANTTDKD